MACTTSFRTTIYLIEPWRTLRCNPISSCVSSSSFVFQKSPSLRCGCRIAKDRKYQFTRRTSHLLNCSHIQNPSSQDDHDHDHAHAQGGPPQEAVLKAISEVSKTEGRVGQTTNVVIGGTVTDDATNEWVALDQKVNVYPTFRGFTAIGIGGDDFVQAMVLAVESVLQNPVPEGKVKQKISSGGKYVSVNIGPVQVVSSEQVQAVYNAMRRDDRMKYFL